MPVDIRNLIGSLVGGWPRRNDSAQIVDAFGWRQGSVFSIGLGKKAAKAAGLTLTEQDLLLVSSHDCDVCHGSFLAEPFVEVLVARRLDTDTPDGNFTHSKSHRSLQVATSASGVRRVYAMAIDERGRASRRLLTRERPAGQLETENADVLRRWLGGRYDRAAFPNEFARRSDAASKEMHKALARGALDLSGIFLSMTSEELPPGRDYEVTVIGTMGRGEFTEGDRLVAAMGAVDRFAAELDSCPGITVVHSSVVSEETFTLADLHDYQRWDVDYVTFRRPGSPAAPRH
jgi:hypothetical protein